MDVGDEVVVGNTPLPFWGSGGDDSCSSSLTLYGGQTDADAFIGLGAEEFIFDSEQIVSNENELFSFGDPYSSPSPLLMHTLTPQDQVKVNPMPTVAAELIPMRMTQPQHFYNLQALNYADLIHFPNPAKGQRQTQQSSTENYFDLDFDSVATTGNSMDDISSDSDDSSNESDKNDRATSSQKFIWDENDRKRRFIKSILAIFVKVKDLESQTAAIVQLKAAYESREYTLADAEELLQYKKACWIETIFPTSEELEDDHRYAATILTQKVSSTSVHDHQYNEVSTSSGGGSRSSKQRRMRQAWYQEHGSHGQFNRQGQGQVSKNDISVSAPTADLVKSYIKAKSEREKILREFLTKIFSRVAKLEAETEAKIEIKIEYERHKFNKENYENAEAILKPAKKKRPTVKPKKVPTITQTADPIPGTLFIKFLQNQPSPSPVASPEPPSELNGSVSNPTSPSPSPCPTLDLDHQDRLTSKTASTETEGPICRKCNQHFPPGKCNNSNQICWIRCADPLCQYLVHSACIGFYVHRPADLRRLPQFYCEQHRNWDEF